MSCSSNALMGTKIAQLKWLARSSVLLVFVASVALLGRRTAPRVPASLEWRQRGPHKYRL